MFQAMTIPDDVLGGGVLMALGLFILWQVFGWRLRQRWRLREIDKETIRRLKKDTPPPEKKPPPQ